jgi:hypothetical protein
LTGGLEPGVFALIFLARRLLSARRVRTAVLLVPGASALVLVVRSLL